MLNGGTVEYSTTDLQLVSEGSCVKEKEGHVQARDEFYYALLLIFVRAFIWMFQSNADSILVVDFLLLTTSHEFFAAPDIKEKEKEKLFLLFSWHGTVARGNLDI